jgi:non-specific serine/threonine protein kinase
LPVLRQANDPSSLHSALADLGFIAMHQGDYGAAQAHFDEALAVTQAAGLRVDEAIELHNLGWLASLQEDYPKARARCEESLAIGRAVGDTWVIGGGLRALGLVILRQGDVATARRLLEECLVLQRHIGERHMLAYGLDALGQVATAEAHYAEAQAAFSESLRLRRELGDRFGMAESLDSIAALAAARRQSSRAVQVAGAAAILRDSIGAQLSPMRRAMLDDWLVPLQPGLGEGSTRLAWEAGQNLSTDQAVELALATTEAPTTRAERPSSRSGQRVTGLSPREREVAALLAHGLSNRQIAERLVITERTVAAHIEHILDKLGFASRHQIGAWVTEHGLLS